MTLLGISARIRTRPLHAQDSALAVDAYRSGSTRVLGKNGKFVVLVEHANGAGLFLRKQQATFFSADDAVGVVRSLPDELPLGARRDNAGDSGNCHLFRRGRLREV